MITFLFASNFANMLLTDSPFVRYDADLSQVGKDEATAGGAALKKEGYQFDVAHTSLLTRAQVH